MVGAQLRDCLANKRYTVYARAVINATGPFSDEILKMSDSQHREFIVPSAGVHITLPQYFGSPQVGLLVPKTKVRSVAVCNRSGYGRIGHSHWCCRLAWPVLIYIQREVVTSAGRPQKGSVGG